jgi:predicted transcriptional regulator
MSAIGDILGVLKNGTQTSKQIQAALVLSQRATNHLLTRLHALRQIHLCRPTDARTERLWNIGPAPRRERPRLTPADPISATHSVTGQAVLAYMIKIGKPVTVVDITQALESTTHSVGQALRRLNLKGLIEKGEKIDHPDIIQARRVYLWSVAPGVDRPQYGRKPGNKQVLGKLKALDRPVTTIELTDLMGVPRASIQDALTRLSRRGDIELLEYVPHPTEPGARVALWRVFQPDAPRRSAVEKAAVKPLQVTPEDQAWMQYWSGHRARKMAVRT